MSPVRIAIAGFQHETNTFAPHKADYPAFVKADGWPGLTCGDDLLAQFTGLNIPISGFIEAARADNHLLIPLLWCAAEPSGLVTDDAFERISSRICESLQATEDLDAVYLDLHGAMVVESFEDGEGELLRRVRAVIGPDMPLVISLDLHANITDAMIEQSDAIAVFRTYPHLDMAQTGARAYALLNNILSTGKMIIGMRKIPFLIPLTSQCTDHQPCQSIYYDLARLEQTNPAVVSAEFAPGFPSADIAECGPSILIHGQCPTSVDSALDDCLQQIVNAEPQFVSHLLSLDEAIRQAQLLYPKKPVVLADVQDNPGGGGTSDTTGLLAALVTNQAQGAVLAMLYDPQVAELAHQSGTGQQLHIRLGGKSGFPGVLPYDCTVKVEALGDGRFTCTGEMYRGIEAQLGPMALLRIIDPDSDVRVIVNSERAQCLDLAMLRHLGVEPTEQRILAIKSTVHFRADFDPVSAETLLVCAPGAVSCKLEELPYRNLRPGIRVAPMAFELADNMRETIKAGVKAGLVDAKVGKGQALTDDYIADLKQELQARIDPQIPR